MTMSEQNIIDVLARADLYTFARRMFSIAYPGQEFDEADYLRLLAAVLMKVRVEPGRRQIVTMPPRHLKSYFATVALTAWLLGHNPALNLMIASHTQVLSSAHLRLVRKLMKSELYARIFGTRIGGKDSETEMETAEGGRVLAVSFEAAPTGRGCDGLIVDDPLKADDARSSEALEACERFYRDSLLSRLNHPGKGFVLVVMQRLAQGDLAGRLAETRAFEQLTLPLEATTDEQIEYEDFSGRHDFTRAAGLLLNPKRSGPYELLTDTYSRPKYRELDPTLFMYIGFPFFFGFMLLSREPKPPLPPLRQRETRTDEIISRLLLRISRELGPDKRN
jgi:hypothetical protein